METKNSNELLEEAIVRELTRAAQAQEGNARHDAYSNVATLFKAKTEWEKISLESADRYEQRLQEDEHYKKEMEMKRQQFNEQLVQESLRHGEDIALAEAQHSAEMKQKQSEQKDSRISTYVSIGTGVATTLIGIVAYGIWMNKGLKFEETGTITNPWTKNLMNKMLPNKK